MNESFKRLFLSSIERKFSPSLENLIKRNVCYLFITREYSFKLMYIEKKERKKQEKDAYFKKLRLDEHPHTF